MMRDLRLLEVILTRYVEDEVKNAPTVIHARTNVNRRIQQGLSTKTSALYGAMK